MSVSQYHWMEYIMTTFSLPQMGREDSLDALVPSCLWQLTDRAEAQMSLDQNLPS